MTHKDLVRKAQAWLRNSKHCTVVIAELATTHNNETPDAIGFFASGGGSILIECKASRADYLADKNKVFRREEELGMGDQRYFFTMAGLIKPEELPDTWGLLELHDKQVRIKKEAQIIETVNKNAEIIMLVSVLRRLELSTAVFVRQTDDEV